MPSTSALVDSIYTRRVSAGECYPPDLVKSQSFYVAYPDFMKKALEERLGDSFSDYFEIHPDTAFGGNSDFSEMGEELGLRNFPLLIEESRNQVAKAFVDGRNGWHFNAAKYGIWDINFACKQGERELRSLQMSLYDTDYFTFNVMQSIYRKMRQDDQYQDIVKDMTEDLTPAKLHRYRAFLGALGVNALVILDDPKLGKVCVFAERSSMAADSKGKGTYHITMNEGLTLSDKDAFEGRVRLSNCLNRGLWEELGLTTDELAGQMTAMFRDLFLVKSSYQLGISATVQLTQMSFIELFQKVECAKDRKLEVGRLEPVGMDSDALEEFFQQHRFIPYSKYGSSPNQVGNIHRQIPSGYRSSPPRWK